MIWIKLFLKFFKIGLFSFGGGYAMIPLIEREITSNQWMNPDEFGNIIAIAEMTPGPIAVNTATFVGYKVLGILGGVVATLGVAMPSILIILIVADFFFKFLKHPLNEALFYVLRPTIAALILSAAFFVAETSLLSSDWTVYAMGDLWQHSKEIINFKGVLIFAINLLAIAKFKLHPIFTIVCSGALGILFFYIL